MRRAVLAAVGFVATVSLWAAPCFGDRFALYPKRLKTGPNVTSIVAADLNSDGWPEIVTADRGRMADPRDESPALNLLSYFAAKGNLEYERQTEFRTGFGPYRIAVANIDALKAPDLVVVNFLATRNRDVTLLRNFGDHLFEPFDFPVSDERVRYLRDGLRDADNRPYFTTPGLTSLTIDDLDKDGYRDIVATGWCSDVLAILPGAADPYFKEAVLVSAPGGPRDIQAADFDGDGHTDFATAMYSSNEIVVWRGDGQLGLEEADRFSSRGRLPQRIQVADMNRDEHADIVVSHCHADDSIVIFYGEGGFRFRVAQEIELGKDRRVLEHEIRDIAVGDFDADGRMDIAAACHRSGQVVVLLNRSSETEPAQSFRRETYSFRKGKPRVLCIGDFNKDDVPDLAVALWESHSVALLLGKGVDGAKNLAR